MSGDERAPADPEEPGPSWAPGYAHATPEHAPIQFRFRARPEDFVVEEIPRAPPDGAGEHVWIEIEKRGISTPEAARRLARALGIDAGALGFAGRKDARAIARQWLSIGGADERALARIELEGLAILRVARSRRKLRMGDLAGNHFRLRLGAIGADGIERARAVLAVLATRGVPNYVGAQRFGRSGLAWRLGRAHLARDWRGYLRELVAPAHARASPALDALREAIARDDRAAQRRLARIADDLDSDLAPLARQLARRPGAWDSAVRAIPRVTRSLHLSAFQSRVFNRVLARRGALYDHWIEGDLAWEHASRALSPVVRVTGELAERLARGELSPTGPLHGPELVPAGGVVRAAEEACLAAEGLAPSALAAHVGFGLRGARRPLRAPLADVALEPDGADAWLAFTLPPGAFATTVVEELGKVFARGRTPPEATPGPRKG